MKRNSTPKAEVLYSFAKHTKKSFSVTFFVPAFLLLLFISINDAKAQPPVPEYPSLTFNSPVLISGTDLQVNAVYNFPNVVQGVDAHVTIMRMVGGAWLAEIDNTTGAGYYDAFQPYVGAAAGDTSYIEWKFVFKKAGTFTDTTLPTLAVTGVDVDGDAAALKEFIQAATPGSFALEPGTYLDFSFDGVRSTATSTIDNYPLIDTANRKSMFQMNFTNINTILYRNGAITTGGSQIRQTSIYFKSFFNTQTLLPVKLLSFAAKTVNTGTDIKWSATNEEELKYYVVQKSIDGIKWKDITSITPSMAGNTNTYSITDRDENKNTTYYRLLQVSTNGSSSYSKTIKLTESEIAHLVTNSYLSGNKINFQLKAKSADDYVFAVYSMTGAKIMSVKNKVNAGISQYGMELPVTSGKGVFVLVVRNKSGQLVYNTKIAFI
jgi:hypothetical protein